MRLGGAYISSLIVSDRLAGQFGGKADSQPVVVHPALWTIFACEGRLLYVGSMRPELLRQLEEVVWVDNDRLSGAPCFRGTRIPVQMLIDHLTAGFSLDEFLETVPSLERTQAQRFLELAGEQMKECASSLTNA